MAIQYWDAGYDANQTLCWDSWSLSGRPAVLNDSFIYSSMAATLESTDDSKYGEALIMCGLAATYASPYHHGHHQAKTILLFMHLNLS